MVDIEKGMTYKNFKLDDFQVEAIASLERNNSVVVSASTGTGKTLIADYVINKYINEGRRIVYTAPIKALSNQKYKDFHDDYGDKVGIMTGDIVVNPGAPLLIMTTEIYRNMLVSQDPSVDKVSYVVFDEIHYINDIERGTVWEESIIFSPTHVRFLCLLATIPNADEFADWIESIQKHKVDTVTYTKRAVPLKHCVFDLETGMISPREYKKLADMGKYNNYNGVIRRKRGKSERNRNLKVAKHYDLVNELTEKNLLPCIYFVFSRKACEEKAADLRNDFTTPEEKAQIIKTFDKHVPREYYKMDSVKLMKNVLPKGIGVHHAGLLPQLKSTVEELFAKGLISVLYATETFAVGINMPARAVAFSSLEKYDGISFRYLNTKEYFQMAGRAGRRGIDKEGTAVSLMDKKYSDYDKIVKITDRDVEPIKSQFKLSVNTVLNLLANFDDEKVIENILKSSFDYYLRRKDNKNIRIMGSYKNYLKRLKKYDYVDEENNLTDKGIFARYIYSNELLITEIFYTNLFGRLGLHEIAIILAAVVYEPRRSDWFSKIKMKQEYNSIISKIEDNQFVNQKIDRQNMRKIMPLVVRWMDGAEFTELMQITNLAEGDIIRLFRQVVDMLRQIIRATRDEESVRKLSDVMNSIFRDVIVADF